MNATTNTNQNSNKMNTGEIQRILTLEKSLNGLSITIFFMIFCIGIVFGLYAYNPDIFTKQFGYSLILTIILVFSVLGAVYAYNSSLKENPGATINNLIQNYSTIPIVIFVVFIIGLIIAILSTLGVFSGSFSIKNNPALLFNYIIIIILIGITGYVYKKNSTSDADTVKRLPGYLQAFYGDKKKYTIIFVLYLLVVIGLYIYNPGGFMTKYGGINIFLNMFIGVVLFLIIKKYEYYFVDPQKAAALKGEPPGGFGFKNVLYILIGLGVSIGFFYLLIKSLGFLDDSEDKSTKGYIIKTIVNIVFIIGMFTVLYKLVNAGGFLSNNPIFRLIFNTILYIPCLLVVLIDYITDLTKKTSATTATGTGTINPLGTAVTAATTLHGATEGVTGSTSKSPIVFGNTTKNDLKFLAISVGICGTYLLMNYIIIPYGMTSYYKQGGKQLINQPILTDKLTNVATYENLNGSDKLSYQYAISFWFYIDSFSPSTSSSYLKTVPIFSYGDNPCIKYDASTNSLLFTVKQTTSEDIVNTIQKLETNIKKENIEKWNAIQGKIKSGIEMVKSLPVGNDADKNGNRIIYKRSDILLQKWNNIVINYNGGTLDIFYNGELVKSAIEVVPKLSYDMLTVGTDNGISGNIANLIYFDHPLNFLTVNRLYTMLKAKNPPTISTIDKTLIPLPSEY